MDGESTSATVDIAEYAHVLVRQWRVILAAAVVGIFGAVGFLTLAPRQYTATTTVNLTVISTEPFAARSAPSSLLDDQEERAIAQSHVVAVRAAESMGGNLTASEIREASSVSTSSGAAVVSVGFTASSPQAATDGADAVASAYLSYRRDRADDRIAVLVDGLTARIDDIEDQVAELDDALSALESGDPAAARYGTERQQMLTELDGLLAERNGLQSVDTTAGFVLSSAADNAMETTPSGRLTLLTGLAGGVVLGVLAAFLRNPRDRRLRTGSEIARALGGPVLAQISAADEQIPARGQEADNLRVARERMLADVGPGDTLAVIDASHGGHLSRAALNLAVVTAQSGERVQLIVPEDPQHVRVRMSAVFEPGESGVAMAGSGGALRFVGATDVGEESQRDLLITHQITRAIESADQRTLTFLVLSADACPASILAAMRMSQVTMLVTRERATTTTEIAWLRQEAGNAGTRILGAIVENARRRSGGGSRRGPSRTQLRESARTESVRRSESVRRDESVPAVS